MRGDRDTMASRTPVTQNGLEQDICSEGQQAFATRRSFVKVAWRVLSIFAASRQKKRTVVSQKRNHSRGDPGYRLRGDDNFLGVCTASVDHRRLDGEKLIAG